MHPHRGIETITYIIEGQFVYRYSKGNEGDLKAGEEQWMTAGRYGMHCFGCVAARYENFEQGALAHGIDVPRLLKDLNSETVTN